MCRVLWTYRSALRMASVIKTLEQNLLIRGFEGDSKAKSVK